MLTRKILLMGYSGSGKNSVCRILESPKFGLKCGRASIHYAHHIIFPRVGGKLGYINELECWQDRDSHRQLWFNLIKAHNVSFPARSGNRIWRENDVYSGLRDAHEYQVLKARRMFDVAIWIDAFPRVLNEEDTVITVGPQHADYILPNHGPAKQLPQAVDALMRQLGISTRSIR